jgi:hypothetical protein
MKNINTNINWNNFDNEEIEKLEINNIDNDNEYFKLLSQLKTKKQKQKICFYSNYEQYMKLKYYKI